MSAARRADRALGPAVMPEVKRRRSSTLCPMLPLLRGCFGRVCARRDRRCPARAHAGAVGAARRLRCGARPGVAPHNSLRSLRSLRSNRCGESDNEARCARRPQSCAPRRPRNRPRRAPPAATGWVFSTSKTDGDPSTSKTDAAQQRRVRAAPRRASEAPRSAGLGARARSAPPFLTRRRCPSAVSAANVVSSAPGPRDRAPQGSRRNAPAASAKRRGAARTRLCPSDRRAHSGRPSSATGSKRNFAAVSFQNRAAGNFLAAAIDLS